MKTVELNLNEYDMLKFDGSNFSLITDDKHLFGTKYEGELTDRLNLFKSNPDLALRVLTAISYLSCLKGEVDTHIEFAEKCLREVYDIQVETTDIESRSTECGDVFVDTALHLFDTIKFNNKAFLCKPEYANLKVGWTLGLCYVVPRREGNCSMKCCDYLHQDKVVTHKFNDEEEVSFDGRYMMYYNECSTDVADICPHVFNTCSYFFTSGSIAPIAFLSGVCNGLTGYGAESCVKFAIACIQAIYGVSINRTVEDILKEELDVFDLYVGVGREIADALGDRYEEAIRRYDCARKGVRYADDIGDF